MVAPWALIQRLVSIWGCHGQWGTSALHRVLRLTIQNIEGENPLLLLPLCQKQPIHYRKINHTSIYPTRLSCVEMKGTRRGTPAMGPAGPDPPARGGDQE